MMSKRSEKIQNHHSISWEQVCHLLTNHYHNQQSHNSKANQKKKFTLKILDTIFFHKNTQSDLAIIDESSGDENKCRHNNIREWFFTTKKGEVARRKDPNTLTLQHLHDRFCRFALANSSNAAGPRIVATGYMKSIVNDRNQSSTEGSLLKQRVNLTVDQLKRQIYHEKDNILCKCMYMQSYLRPHEGRDQFFRGCYRLSIDSNEYNTPTKKNKHKSDIKSDVLVQIYEDPPSSGSNNAMTDLSDCNSSQLLQWIQTEVEATTLKVVNYLESAIELLSAQHTDNASNRTKIVALLVDFILDDNKHLWITSIDNVIISSDGAEEQIHAVSKEYSEQYIIDGDSVRHSSPQNRLLPQVIDQSLDLNKDNKKKKGQSSSSKQRKTKDRGDISRTNINLLEVKDTDEIHGDALQTQVSGNYQFRSDVKRHSFHILTTSHSRLLS